MSRYRKFTTICCAVVFALGLAGCGGGSDGVPQATHDQVTETVTELRAQIAALQARLGIEDGADPGHDVADLQDQIDDLQKMVDDAEDKARMEAEEETRKANAATGKALFAALAGTDATNNSLANVTASTLGTAGLGLTVANDAGTLTGAVTVPTLKAGDSAGALGSWSGTNYGDTNAETKVENAAVVYNNKGPGSSRSFAAAGITVYTGTTDATNIKGYVSLGATPSDAAVLRRIGGAAFTHSGLQDHAYDSVSQTAFTTRGTYAGASGEYRCTGDCSSTNDGKGSPSALGGTWWFKPDAGTNAMTHTPDADYLYYGWWVQKDKDGDPTAASAFTGTVGTAPAGSGTPILLADGAAITGSATYVGHAAGKFALDYSKSKLIDGASDGGHFTADVELTATFGGGTPTPTNAGVTGFIDNFRLNDGTEDPLWRVTLHRANWGTTGAFATPATDVDTTMANETLGTTWSIDGTAADRSGTWSGQMYDEMPGNTDSVPPGDGSNIPTTTTGTFYSEYGAGTSTVGRMVGAFGATKE